MCEESGLSYIDVPSQALNPLTLFSEWFEEVKKSELLMPETLTFATSNSDGCASARNLLLRLLDDDGFVIATDRHSRKSRDLAEVPRATIVFCWVYNQDGCKIIRQVRAWGGVTECDTSVAQQLYDKEPLYCKVRSHLSYQGQGVAVNWQEQKDAHDRIVKEVREDGRLLPMPDHFVAYKLVPEGMDFYFAREHWIADRAMFVKSSDGSWTNHKIIA